MKKELTIIFIRKIQTFFFFSGGIKYRVFVILVGCSLSFFCYVVGIHAAVIKTIRIHQTNVHTFANLHKIPFNGKIFILMKRKSKRVVIFSLMLYSCFFCIRTNQYFIIKQTQVFHLFFKMYSRTIIKTLNLVKDQFSQSAVLKNALFGLLHDISKIKKNHGYSAFICIHFLTYK